MDFKNVQRRVYDALNVLSAMEIIHKNKNHIVYHDDNEFIDDTVFPNTLPPSEQVKLANESIADLPDIQPIQQKLESS